MSATDRNREAWEGVGKRISDLESRLAAMTAERDALKVARVPYSRVEAMNKEIFAEEERHRAFEGRFVDAMTLLTQERDRLRQPCALLRDGQCSIYQGRPEACRVHHASDAAVCAAHIADPDVDLEAVYIPTLRARMFAVMIGMDEAIEAAGFDDRAYDFGSALHEALTNSLCRVLWLRKKTAFPDSCLAAS